MQQLRFLQKKSTYTFIFESCFFLDLYSSKLESNPLLRHKSTGKYAPTLLI